LDDTQTKHFLTLFTPKSPTGILTVILNDLDETTTFTRLMDLF